MTPAPRRIKAKAAATRPGGWISTRFKVLSWGAVALVLFNTVAMLLLPLGAPARAAGVDGVGGRIFVCTAAGLVEWGADGLPVSGESASHGDVCVNCLPLLSAVLCCPAGGAVHCLRPAGFQSLRQEGLPPALAVHRPSARSPPAT